MHARHAHTAIHHAADTTTAAARDDGDEGNFSSPPSSVASPSPPPPSPPPSPHAPGRASVMSSLEVAAAAASGGGRGHGYHSPWIRKPLSVVLAEHQRHGDVHRPQVEARGHPSTTNNDNEVRRHLTLLDLLSVGVGGTIGSGIFVLCGLIARTMAGPATFLSWFLAGIAASLSGICFAELASEIPTGGSSYAYGYVSMGELPAFLSAACLTLEYLVSGAAVARSWGDKVVEWISVYSSPEGQEHDGGADNLTQSLLDPGLGINPMAFLLSACCTALLLSGVRESKSVTNAFTGVKIGLVAFMIVVSFRHWDTGNFLLHPSGSGGRATIIPPEFGFSGVVRGATSSFFGYVGYDEVCCLAGEAVNPRRDVPRAVMLTICIVTCLYMVAAVALVGMVPYQEISETGGFPDGFRRNGPYWAASVASAGEVLTLPVVVLISLMAQPRLQLALARDGLLPRVFGEVDSTGNIRRGTLIAGVLMTVTATFVPFAYLNDLISAGILVSFCMTDSSVVLLRYGSPKGRPRLLECLLAAYHALSLVACLILRYSFHSNVGKFLTGGFCVALVRICFLIRLRCHRSWAFGGKRSQMPPTLVGDAPGGSYFKTPCVPFLPCLGIFTNWYLIAQLDSSGFALLIIYLGLATLAYFSYGAKNSVGSSEGWVSDQYVALRQTDEIDDVGDHSMPSKS